MIKGIVIGLFLSMKIFDAYIEHLDNTYLDKPLPDNVKDVYSENEYETWKNYNTEGAKVSNAKDYLLTAITFLMLLFNVYAIIYDLPGNVAKPIKYLVMILVFECFFALISIPFNYYDTFVIEEKYGLNKSTKKLFFIDTLKSLALSIIIEYAVLMLIYFLYETFGNYAFLLATGVFLAIALILALIIVPIMKIFNKFTPLEDGELKDKLLELCDKYNIRIKKVVVKDASRRTTRANAFCSGYGKLKTISLDDNLVNEYSTDQIIAVFAHEFAHAKEKHILKSFPFSCINTLLTFAALGLALNISGLYEAFGFSDINYMFVTIITSYLIWPLEKVFRIIGNYISRKHEYAADSFAAKEGYGDDLIAALKKLSKESMSDINPHPAVVWLEYSHPTLSQRITAIENASHSYVN